MKADLIIANGAVLTMDPLNPRAEAIAIIQNKIAAVGEWAEIKTFRAGHTKMIDATGSTVLPGFIESHVHIFMGAAELDNLDLSTASSFKSLADAIIRYGRERPALPFLFANQVSYSVLGDTKLPTRHDLDRILPNRPFAMMTYDHHTVFANTRALEAAGILRGASVPIGSEIVMGPDGIATGELREPGAFKYILALTPTGGRDSLGFTDATEPNPGPSSAERRVDRDLLLRGLSHCASFGITSLHNMDGNFYTLELLSEIDAAGLFTCRCQSPFHFKNYFEVQRLGDATEMARRFKSKRVSSGRVKLFMDGVLESWTAFTLDDYPDKPGHRGAPNFTAEQFNEIAIEADRRGLQIDVHAIADGAVRRTLDGFAAARNANGPRDSRHRIEHVETIHPADLPRFSKLGVIASMQPTHAPGPVFPLEPTLTRIGETMLPLAYAWQTIRETGARMCFNSDWPISPVNPMVSIHAALTRKPYRQGDPEQRQSLVDVLRGYTSDGAFAEFKEHSKGMLSQGFLADAVVLSRNLESTDPASILTTRATLTVCDGRVTHDDF